MNAELAYLDSLQGSGIRPGLRRMRAFLRAAGHPEKAFPSILVAGTNGKGSTCATVASIVSAAGYRCALYTSPHLVDIRERWMIAGEPVSPSTLRSAIRELRAISSRSRIRLTYFEAMTAVAFLLFREVRCDLAVLEVGMGGRLDATNVVRPLLSLITSVSFDHMEYLGNTIRKIAREKAGIIHRDGVALTSATDLDVLDVLKKRSADVGVAMHVVQDECEIESSITGTQGIEMALRTARGTYQLQSSLSGDHQLANLTLSVRAAEELRGRFPSIDRRAIERGVANARWRGRLERFLVSGKDVWVDGAHNAGAAERLAEFVQNSLAPPRTLVFGIMADKEVEKVASTLFPLFGEIVLTEPASPRAAPVEVLKKLAPPSARTARRPITAVTKALALSPKTIVVAGSLYLAGDAVRLFDRKIAAASEAKSSTDDRNQAAATRKRRRPKRTATAVSPGGR